MRTKLSVVAASLAESAWLTALAATPVFFNPHSVRIFDEDKALLLRSLALLIAAALAICAIETARGAPTASARRLWHLPLVRPVLTLCLVYAAATATSIDPWTSFWGAYVRGQGLYTWLSYITVFMALLLLVRERGQVERLVTVVLLASVAPAAYAICQHFGFEPMRWAIDTRARVIGTAGNAIFIGAYMIMVAPLTLSRLIEQVSIVRGTVLVPAETIAASVRVLAYAMLLMLQLLTLVFSESRGPFLGLAAGLTFYFVVYAAHRRRRAVTVATVAVIAAATVFLVLFNASGSPISAWRSLPYVGRMGQLLEVGAGTGKVRALIWDGATRLLAAHPDRLLLGHGPETMFLVYPPFYPPALSYVERRGVIPDRSHNESFDVLIMTGAAGLVAGLAVYMGLFVNGLGWLGMISNQRQRWSLVALMTGGAVLGTILPMLLDGSARFAGVGLPVGFLVGLLGYVLGRALIDRASATPSGDDLLLIGLMSAIVAHFVEVHFGIAVTTTQLYFWAYVALVVLLGKPLLRATPTALPVWRPVLAGDLLIVSPTVGLLLALLWFGFYNRGLDSVVAVPMLTAVLGGTWLMGACLIAAEPQQGKRRLAGLTGYAAISFGILFVFIGAQALWSGAYRNLTETTPEVLHAIGYRAVRLSSSLFSFVLLLVLLQATVQALRQRPLPLQWIRSAATGIVAIALSVVAVIAAVVSNILPLRADVLAKQGQIAEGAQQLEAARLLYEDAHDLQPRETTYAVHLGRILIEQVRRGAAADREHALGEAQAVLESAQAAAPLMVDHPRNLATLHRTWAAVGAETTRAAHLNQTITQYQRAVALAPYNADLRNEWATLYLEQHDGTRAIEVIAASLAVDEWYANTWYLRAQAHLELEQPHEALSDYDRALMLDPTMLAAWSGKALTLAQLGRTSEAIAANEEAARLAPDDLITKRNLALLYQRAGDLRRARQYAELALTLARGDDREKLAQFLRELGED